MKKRESIPMLFHEDPVLFREALNFTAAETAFAPRLIEKDYFCTLLLEYLASDTSLVFKGGTCLAKVHTEFYRLSEDLDFAIPMPVDASRRERSARATGLKKTIAGLAGQHTVFRISEAFGGGDDSRQYMAEIQYTSLLAPQEESIRLEVGLREPLLKPVQNSTARTILLNPVTGRPLVPPFAVNALSLAESLSEKFRAALSRREVAIRDYYDIDFAVRKLGIIPEDVELIGMVRQKLAVPGNESVGVSSDRLAALQRQLEPELKPVLRDRDFAEFDLDRAFETVAQMAANLS